MHDRKPSLQEVIDMLKELVKSYAEYFRETNPDWSAEEVHKAAVKAVTNRDYGFGLRQSDRLASLLYGGGLKSQLHGMSFAAPPTDPARLLASFDAQVPVDRLRRDGWVIRRKNHLDGSEVALSDTEQAAAFAQIARASKPSIFCARCRSPLGTRLPAGPKGELAPVVYVRGARCVPETCNKLWWELPDGRRVLSCTHAHLQATLEVFHELMYPVTQEHIDSCPDREHHALVKAIYSRPEIMSRIDEDWTYAFGVAQLIRWKNTALLHQGDVILKFEADRIALGKITIPYDQGDKEPVFRVAYVPLAGIPLFHGTRGCCPKCGHIQRLE